MKCELKMATHDVKKYFHALNWKNVFFVLILTLIFTLINIYISIYISMFGILLVLIWLYKNYHNMCN